MKNLKSLLLIVLFVVSSFATLAFAQLENLFVDNSINERGDRAECFKFDVLNQTDEIEAVIFYLKSSCVSLERFTSESDPVSISQIRPEIFNTFLRNYIREFKRSFNPPQNRFIDIAFEDTNFLYIIDAFTTIFPDVHDYYYYKTLSESSLDNNAIMDNWFLAEQAFGRLGRDQQAILNSSSNLTKVKMSYKFIEDIDLAIYPYYDAAVSLAEEQFQITIR